MTRIGLLGGTFDPPHVGHTGVAEDVRRALELDAVWLLPARIPPHKRDTPITAAPIRLAMVRAAVDGTPGLGVSEIEMDRETVSWTADTLRGLHAEHPDTEFFLIMGADQFQTLATWKEPEVIDRLATVVVLARDGVEPPRVAPGTSIRGLPVTVRRVDVSSSEIREAIARREDVGDFVRKDVLRLIDAHHLYGPDPT